MPAPTIQEAWREFHEERSITLCATSMVSDYRQVTKWITRCPIEDTTEGRAVMKWVLNQRPIKSARRVCMYIKALYNWAASEEIGYLERNPIA